MKGRHGPMPILRLAYTTQFLIALIAIFVLWSQVGGQSHLDLLPWWVKLGLGVASAYTIVRATVASVSGDRAWNGQTLRWLGVMLAILAACGYATYYAHMNLEESDEEARAGWVPRRATGRSDGPSQLREETRRAHGKRGKMAAQRRDAGPASGYPAEGSAENTIWRWGVR